MFLCFISSKSYFSQEFLNLWGLPLKFVVSSKIFSIFLQKHVTPLKTTFTHCPSLFGYKLTFSETPKHLKLFNYANFPFLLKLWEKSELTSDGWSDFLSRNSGIIYLKPEKSEKNSDIVPVSQLNLWIRFATLDDSTFLGLIKFALFLPTWHHWNFINWSPLSHKLSLNWHHWIFEATFPARYPILTYCQLNHVLLPFPKKTRELLPPELESNWRVEPEIRLGLVLLATSIFYHNKDKLYPGSLADTLKFSGSPDFKKKLKSSPLTWMDDWYHYWLGYDTRVLRYEV